MTSSYSTVQPLSPPLYTAACMHISKPLHCSHTRCSLHPVTLLPVHPRVQHPGMMPIPHAFNLLGWVAACGSLLGVAGLTYWTNTVMVQVGSSSASFMSSEGAALAAAAHEDMPC